MPMILRTWSDKITILLRWQTSLLVCPLSLPILNKVPIYEFVFSRIWVRWSLRNAATIVGLSIWAYVRFVSLLPLIITLESSLSSSVTWHTVIFLMNRALGFLIAHLLVFDAKITPYRRRLLSRLQCSIQKLCGACYHHGRIISIPLAFSVLVGIASTQDLLLMLGVLEIGLWKHVLEVLSTLVFVILYLNVLSIRSILVNSLKSLCPIECITISLRILLHSHHGKFSLNFNSSTVIIMSYLTTRSCR